jgi:hypothetical protein
MAAAKKHTEGTSSYLRRYFWILRLQDLNAGWRGKDDCCPVLFHHPPPDSAIRLYWIAWASSAQNFSGCSKAQPQNSSDRVSWLIGGINRDYPLKSLAKSIAFV